MSGEITRTPDLTLTSTENITNAKLNRVGGGTYKVDENSITHREAWGITDWVNVKSYGAKGDGTTDDTAAIQAAINYAKTNIVENTATNPNNIVTATVFIPAGRYVIASTVTTYEGIRIKGSSRSTTLITHTGTSVNCLQTAAGVDNRQVWFEDFSLVGNGANTLKGIKVNDAYFDSGISNVTVNNCYDNIYITGSWTFRLEGVNSNNSTNDCCWVENWTAGYAVACRFDDAGRYGMYIQRDATTPNNSFSTQLNNCYFQRAQQSGFYGEDLSSVDFINCYWEGNNKAIGAYPDVKLNDLTSKGHRFTFTNCYASSTGSGGANMSWIDVEYAIVVDVTQCYLYNGTTGFYDYGVTTAIGVSRLNVIGCGVLTGTISEFNLHSATKLFSIGNQDDNIKIPSLGSAHTTTSFAGDGNFMLEVSAPANRRAEVVLSSAGTGKWYVGRGDSDDPLAGACYISEVSGGGTNPPIAFSPTSKYVGFNVLMSSSALTGVVDINHNDIRIRQSQTPASSSAAGNQGEIAWDASYLYVCITTDTWQRVAHATWP